MGCIYFGHCGCDEGDGDDDLIDPGANDGGGDEWVENNAFWWGRYTVNCIRKFAYTKSPILGSEDVYLDMIRQPRMITSDGPSIKFDHPVYPEGTTAESVFGQRYDEMGDIGGFVKGELMFDGRPPNTPPWEVPRLFLGNFPGWNGWDVSLFGETIERPAPYLIFAESINVGFVRDGPILYVQSPGMEGVAVGGFWSRQLPWQFGPRWLLHRTGIRTGETHLTPGLRVQQNSNNLFGYNTYQATSPWPGGRWTFRVSFLPWDDFPNTHGFTEDGYPDI